MNRIFLLVKFLDKPDHVRDFIQGKIYCKRLAYFKRLEADGDPGRSDPHEGTKTWLQPEQGRIVLNGRDISAGLAGPIQIQMNWLDHLHVHCIHAVHSGTVNPAEISNTNIEELRREFIIPESCLSLGQYAVVVQNVSEFVRRMRAAAGSKDYPIVSRLVKYYDPEVFHGGFEDAEAVFQKRREFSYQREYRFALDTGIKDDCPLVLDIGDISDITMQMTPHELNGPQLLGGQMEIAHPQPHTNA